jgi:protein-S-isoprenylcysteine O-methyltransferase Ste14
MVYFHPTTDQLPRPLFELRGIARRFDLSAWLAGVVLTSGIAVIGPGAFAADEQSGGFGIYLLAASFLTFLTCVLYLQWAMKLSLTATSFGEPRALTTTGVFGITRNPIYVAFLLPLTSLCYFSVTTALATIVAYITLMNLTVIRKEELELQLKFGEDYSAYRTILHLPMIRASRATFAQSLRARICASFLVEAP